MFKLVISTAIAALLLGLLGVPAAQARPTTAQSNLYSAETATTQTPPEQDAPEVSTPDGLAENLSTAPVIIQQPADQYLALGAPVIFSVRAENQDELTVRWQKSMTGRENPFWVDQPGSQNEWTWETDPASMMMAGHAWRAVVTSKDGKSTASNAAVLTLGHAPRISTQPIDVTVLSGEVATFTAGADGTGDLAVQWQYSLDGKTWTDSNEPSAQSWRFTTPPRTPDHHGWMYRAVVTSVFGTATTNVVRTWVQIPVPVVVSTPADGARVLAGDVHFTGSAQQGAALSFEVDGAPSDTRIDNETGQWSHHITLAPGDHTIRFWQTDAPDVAATTTVTAVEPVVTITSPATDTVWTNSASPVQIAGVATANTGAQLRYSLNGVDTGAVDVAPDGTWAFAASPSSPTTELSVYFAQRPDVAATLRINVVTVSGAQLTVRPETRLVESLPPSATTP